MACHMTSKGKSCMLQKWSYALWHLSSPGRKDIFQNFFLLKSYPKRNKIRFVWKIEDIKKFNTPGVKGLKQVKNIKENTRNYRLGLKKMQKCVFFNFD